ncbi:GL25744 [Drosophila persimilis]|uniref:GL25744 n=1 Tax=Drosophila persimilis TaxID=7234 RepID=B4GK54_DROPE|nr:GL25744 [Drosophila persimilis]
MPLSTLDVDTIIDVLDLAHLYGLQVVESGIGKYLQQNLSVSNVCTILDVARRKNLNQRAEECLNFIDNNGSDIVKHDSFEKLSKESLEELLRRDKLAALEIDIFRAVCKWRDNHPSEDFKTVAELVRLPLLTVQQLVQEVRPSGLFEPDQIFNAIGQVDTGKNLPYRVVVLPEKNVASEKHLARRFQDEQNHIVFELRNLFAINFIELIFQYGSYSISFASETLLGFVNASVSVESQRGNGNGNVRESPARKPPPGGQAMARPDVQTKGLTVGQTDNRQSQAAGQMRAIVKSGQ